MQLLLDQGLPGSTASLLRETGIDAIHAAEIGLSTAEDTEILQKALEEERIVVTLDADFHALLALNESTSPSVIRIRIQRLKAQGMTDLLVRVINECEEDLLQGAVVTVETSRIRVRRLPLLS
ncbi:MAG: DUF5615 family PIN-like protein [Cyanobacteria bacterium P01_D01_bin.116]